MWALNLAQEGELDITLKVIITGEHSGWRMLPTSQVASIGLFGVAGLRFRQKTPNIMAIGDVIRMMIAEKRCRFKRFKQATSLDLYRAYQQNENLTFGFAFAVREGDYFQKALFSSSVSKISEYNTNARAVYGVTSPEGLELIDFEFAPENTNVDYGKELDAMFLHRVKEQQRRILKTLGALK